MIMLPGKENHSNLYLTKVTTHDYEDMYQLDVHGLANTTNVDRDTVYTEFKK